MLRFRWCIYLALMNFVVGCGRTVTDMQRDSIARYRPGAPVASGVGVRFTDFEMVVYRVAVVADQDYRRRYPDWRAEIVERFKRVNAYSMPALGVRFSVQQREPWERKSDPTSLTEMLAELERTHPGDRFDFVLGLGPAASQVVLRPDHLGMARMFGKHAVVRAMDDTAELEAFRANYDALDEDEIVRVYYERKHHKERSIVLHEWGHTLGIPHVREREGFMFGAYDARQAGFSNETIDVLRHSLAFQKRLPRIAREEFLTEWADSVAEEVRARREHWDSAVLVDYESKAASATLLRGRSYLSPQASELLVSARRAAEERRFDDAAALLSALLKDYPKDPHVLNSQCQLTSMQRLDGASESACRAASLRGDPRDPWADLVLAHSLAAQRKLVKADSVLTRTRKRIAAHPGALDYWRYYVTVAAAGGLSEHARYAGERLPGDEALDESDRERLLSTQRRYGTHAKDEAAYLEATSAVWKQLVDGEHRAALARSIELRARYPEAIGPQALYCVASIYVEPRPARERCEHVVLVDPEQVLATWGLGILDLAQRRHARAEVRFKRAIELDPWFDSAWSAYESLLRQTGRGDEADALARQSSERFGPR